MRLLASLSEQEYPREKLEVIVVLDGDVDGSEGAIRSGSFGFDVRVVVLPPPDDMLAPPGAGRPRNRGASEASGEIVLFLDDDVEHLRHIDLVLLHSDGRDAWIIEESGAMEELAKWKQRGAIRAMSRPKRELIWAKTLRPGQGVRIVSERD